ncbi:MAG: acetyl-CoA C-acetyltransferase [Planctomycetales bacterium]|nr:acetyl-CoA C-acetyltransferase [Planctomycetales bacterium]
MNPRVVLAQAVRTPIGKFLGAFQDLSAADLGVQAVRALLSRANLAPDRVDEVIVGNARQAGGGPNVGRQIARRAGIPQEVPAYTVNMACGSGLKAVLLAAESVTLGRSRIVVAGGTESMTRVPFLLDRMRLGYGAGDVEVVDGMYRDGFLCPLAKQVMGETAETLADRYRIPREEQDRFAAESQQKCELAWKAGRFDDEIAPVELPVQNGSGPKRVSRDEHPRAGVTAESLRDLAPVFRKDGTIHAGNSSGITDGAAAVLVCSEDAAREIGATPLAFLEASAIVGVDPAIMGIGPVPAVRKLFGAQSLSWDAVDLVELNEAFAAQVLACDRDLRIPRERLNVNGGAIALGHPIGATGARILVTLLYEMRRRGALRGLATLCVSGGLGLAATVVREGR